MELPKVPPALQAPLAFASHVVGGTISFFVVYGVALFASAGVERLNAFLNAPGWLRFMGGWVEAIIFIGDLIALALLLALEIAKLARTLWDGWRTPHG